MMDDTRLFADSQFLPLVPSLIAALWYQLGQAMLSEVEEPLLRAVYSDALEESSQGILRSDRTRQKLLASLQKSGAASVMDAFLREGTPVPKTYIRECFATVISEKNAGKISDIFVDVLSQRLGSDPEMSRKICLHYRETLKKAQWVLPQPARRELREHLKTLEVPGEPVPTVPAAKEREPETERPGSMGNQEKSPPKSALKPGLQANFSGSFQFPSSDFPDYVIPLRGLRKLESALSQAHVVLITGVPGCGKSLLTAALLTAPNSPLSEWPVFYFAWADRFTGHQQLLRALADFYQIDPGELSSSGLEFQIFEEVNRNPALLVFDDLQSCRDPQTQSFIKQIAGQIAGDSAHQARMLLVAQQASDWLTGPGIGQVEYNGLSLAEGVALLRDKAGVSIPKMFYRPISAACNGHPQLLHLFKMWCQAESHADTEIQRFIRHFPRLVDRATIAARYEYVLTRLFTVMEREASWVNSFLGSISVFRSGVPDRFLEHTYQSAKGVDFQQRLEAVTLKYRLIRYDELFNCYFLPPLIREFYYQRFEIPQERRILHKAAAQCYATDFQQNHRARAALECMWHSLQAGREEFLGPLCSEMLAYHFETDFPAEEFLEVLEELSAPHPDAPEDRAPLELFRGSLYYYLKDIEQANLHLNACDDDVLPERNLGHYHYYRGLMALHNGKVEEAIEFLHNALPYQMEIEDLEAQSQTYFSLARAYVNKGDSNAALDMLDAALPLYHQRRDWVGSASVYLLRASIWEAQHAWDLARQALEYAAQEAERCGEKKMIIDIRYRMGEQEFDQGNINTALEHFQNVGELCRQYRDPACQARALERCADIYLQEQNWQKALTDLEEAQRLYLAANDQRGLISVYLSLGKIYSDREKWELAMGFYQKSQELLDEIDDPHHAAMLYRNMADIYRARKEWERTLDMYDQALDIYEKLEAISETITVFEQMGDVYRARGQDTYAVEVYDRALALCEESEDWKKAAEHCVLRAEVAEQSDEGTAVQEWLSKAEAYYRKSGDDLEAAVLQLRIGAVFQRNEEWGAAEEHYGAALAEFFARGDEQRSAEAGYLLGTLYHDKGEWEQALEKYREALPVFETLRDYGRVAQTLGNISSIEFEQGEIRPAFLKLVEILLYFRYTEEENLADKTLANMVACNQEMGESAFQAQLKEILQEVANTGVKWGEEVLIPPAKAEELINTIFYQV